MKPWMYVALLVTALAMIVTGCAQQTGEEIVPGEEVGGEDVKQPLERVQALGTQLDRQPARTETATFALG